MGIFRSQTLYFQNYKSPQIMFKLQWKTLGIYLVAVMTVLVLLITVNTSQSPATIASPTDTLGKVSHPTILAQADDEADVSAIASATTVFINADLENKARLEEEAKRITFEYAGSGVIVARREDNDDVTAGPGGSGTIKNFVHYVLTNAHVVELKLGNPNRGYGLRTPDGEVYTVKSAELLGNPGNDKELDLAVLEFWSDRPYPVATIDRSGVNEGDKLFISGWPTPLPEEPDLTRRRRFTVAQITSKKPPDSVGNFGFTLAYDAASPGVRSGMSGGPVFNIRGELVGIHSGGFDPNPGDKFRGQGIQITQFLQRKANAPGYTFSIAPPSVNRNLIAEAKQKQKQPDTLTPQEFDEGFDVSPTDPSFQAIQSLRERYGCLKPFSDGTSRPKREFTRGQLIYDLEGCLSQVEKLIPNSSGQGEKVNLIRQQIDTLEQEIKLLQ
ncbi:MAG: serine protease [Oscillatoriales cyanobacterium]|nr:MAG: serine protease [Oscillatoriales cyanobacterium]TAE06622.1 MAG: serine protease [Oscillatoriales cyanobacterium]